MNTKSYLEGRVNGDDWSLEGKALILDFGSVISRSVFEKRAEIENRLGLTEGAIKWAGPTDPDNDPLWQDMLNGRMTERDYWAAMAKDVGALLGEDWAPLDFLNAARSNDINMDIRREIVELIDKAKEAGVKVGILSNELELFYGKEAMSSIMILQKVDGIVDATHTKILKPDPRAYAEILALLDVSAADSIFVDDQPRNVKGAEDFGIKSIFFDVRDPQSVCSTVWSSLLKL